MFDRLKRYFIVGFIAILPLWVTYFILLAIFNIVASLGRPYFSAIPLLSGSPLVLNILSFFGTVLAILGLGVFMTNVVGRKLFRMFEASLQRIPILSGIYTSIRKLTDLFLDEEASKKFQRVVLVEYPRKGLFSLGFVTSQGGAIFQQWLNKPALTVFIPTTPNPTSGVLIIVPQDEVISTNISVDGAIKMIISGGVISLDESL